MKKMLSLILVLALCMSLATTVMANDVFVPSIDDKNEPALSGEAELVEGDTVVETVPSDHLVITSVANASKEDSKIPAAAKEELLKVYEGLKDGSVTIPYSKVDSAIDPADMEMRDLFDVSLICTEENGHADKLATENIDIRLPLDLGVKADETVVIMAYVGGEWVPAKKITVNSDGSVTCVLKELCPVVVCVEDTSAPPQTGDMNRNAIGIWAAALGLSAVALVVLFVIYRKKTASK